MAQPENNGAVKKSISFPEDLLTNAEDRAASQYRNLSNYIQFLIVQDLERAEIEKRDKEVPA